MNKTLRFSLLSILMMLCGSVFAEEVTVTFDFSTDKAYSLFGFNGFSSNDSHDGDFTENGSTNSGGVTVTVSPSGGSNANRMWSGSLRLYGGTMTIASADQKITNIAFTLNQSKWADANSANEGTLTKGAWTGEASSVVVTIAGNTQIKSMTVTLGGEGGEGGGGGDSGDDDFTGPTANDIAAFKALDNNTEAKLMLANAEVLYAKNSDIFVRDASGAIDFYNTGLTLTAGQKLNGYVIGKFTTYNNLPELAKTTNTKADGYTATTGTVSAKDIGLDEVAGYVCDLVQVKGVTIAKEDDGNYYASNEDGDKVQVYDKFKIGYETGLEEGKSYDITCIVVAYKDIYELCPIEDFSGGSDVPATAVPNVATLLGLESPSTNLELTLTDAQVLIVDNNYIYVRENGKAICFYQVNAVKEVVKKNSILNGKINVDYEVYKLLPEVKTNKNTTADNLTITDGDDAVPTETTLANVAAGDNVCDLVTLKATLVKEVKTNDGGNTSTTYYLQDGDTKIVVVNNGMGLDKIEEGTEITVVGIANTNNNAHQIKLFKKVEDTTGISNLNVENAGNGQLFNVAGQRVSGSYKGIVIANGKKFVVK